MEIRTLPSPSSNCVIAKIYFYGFIIHHEERKYTFIKAAESINHSFLLRCVLDEIVKANSSSTEHLLTQSTKLPTSFFRALLFNLPKLLSTNIIVAICPSCPHQKHVGVPLMVTFKIQISLSMISLPPLLAKSASPVITESFFSFLFIILRGENL